MTTRIAQRVELTVFGSGSPSFRTSQSFEPIDRPSRQMFREPSPGDEPEHGVVNVWGRLAQTKRALRAGGGRLGRCRDRIQRLFRLARSRTFHNQFVSWGECPWLDPGIIAPRIGSEFSVC